MIHQRCLDAYPLTCCGVIFPRLLFWHDFDFDLDFVKLAINRKESPKSKISSLLHLCPNSLSLATPTCTRSFQAAGKGMINDYSSGSPPNSLRLLCSITGESPVVLRGPRRDTATDDDCSCRNSCLSIALAIGRSRADLTWQT